MATVVSFPLRAKVTARRVQRDKSDSLTELRIEKLKATGAEYYVNDGRQPGLSVRVSAQGVKAFVFTKKKDGRLTRITIDRSPAMRLEDARRAAQKLHGEMALGIDVGAKRRAAKAARKPDTMQDAFDRFLTLKDRRESTVKDYRDVWERHVPATLKRKPVANVTAKDIEEAKQKVGAKRRTANKVVVLLAAVLSKSGRWADNPARGVERYQEHVRTRRLSPDELGRVLSTLDGDDWGDFFRLLILTGARRTAFCAMRWTDLNLEAGAWLVPAVWSKSKREMAIPLAAEAVRILRERRERVAGEWVWPAFSASGHVVEPLIAWRRILTKAGIPHATLHDIRRTLGSRLAMGGVAGETISKVLGHVSPQSRRAYVHLDVAAGREAIERTMAGIIGGPANQG
jgi:integrase